MIKKILASFLFIFLTMSCGFSPIYVEKNNYNFSITTSKFTGDYELNNFLKNNLKKYRNKKSKNEIFISINSEYEKNILTKNSKGEVTNYELFARAIFTLEKEGKKIEISEKKIIKTMDDKFEQARYERTVKQNFASSISNKLLSKLITN